ncbi:MULTISPECIES: hypothetical protein [unclassified Ensifer]|uniref:hypothetical protein n=1 Tax=unclassified Ensifer TaxID=2633371 RepID=UPI000812F9A7|nr:MULTISPECIES: hypothetical protein [unclassified Ensifer]OCP22434.1 hypothetical protein BC361_24585 [Ensifer sp. LC54]OCP22645.1 hypothetical protein BC363_26720 [Ensifer sp. LC384]
MGSIGVITRVLSGENAIFHCESWIAETKSAIRSVMETSFSDLPDDQELRAIIAAQTEELARQSQKLRSRDTLIEKLKAELAVLKRASSGPWW